LLFADMIFRRDSGAISTLSLAWRRGKAREMPQRGESGGPDRLLGRGLAGADIGGPHGRTAICPTLIRGPRRGKWARRLAAPGCLFYLAGRTPPTITTSRTAQKSTACVIDRATIFSSPPRRQCIRSVREQGTA
jgi:hypothetical protein